MVKISRLVRTGNTLKKIFSWACRLKNDQVLISTFLMVLDPIWRHFWNPRGRFTGYRSWFHPAITNINGENRVFPKSEYAGKAFGYRYQVRILVDLVGKNWLHQWIPWGRKPTIGTFSGYVALIFAIVWAKNEILCQSWPFEILKSKYLSKH